jgi:hypothetical protein
MDTQVNGFADALEIIPARREDSIDHLRGNFGGLHKGIGLRYLRELVGEIGTG